MYISVEQTFELDKIIKSNEVALRSFVADVLLIEYDNHNKLKTALESISISDEIIYSKRFQSKLKNYIANSHAIFDQIVMCKASLDAKTFNNDVPYVSDLIELMLIFFNSHFSNKNIAKDFSSVEEFHYCCTLYHRARNNLSHPASRPVSIIDANKVIYFIENTLATLPERYFWYRPKDNIKNDITKCRGMIFGESSVVHNLNYAASTHKNLLCREGIIQYLYDALMGNDVRQRLAGSVVLYGYGGVGKTAITTEFLYRILRDKKDGKYSDIEYLLFFSSKDEYLRENVTTGELYIDTHKPEFSTLEELQRLICSSLKISDIKLIHTYNKRGIITIDNIENIVEEEKTKIINFIKSLPRTVQFIVTSRNEEACEEKIHVEEFKEDALGIEFVSDLIESENLDVDIESEKINSILRVSKGNSLIIIQVLNIIDRKVSSFDEIVNSLGSMRSKNSEMIANFMYKNTFDSALKHLESIGYPARLAMQVISVYDEKIELYSISKLAKIDVSDSERMCNYLLERLILKKTGEYYELNEFAKRFVFIKLLPDRFELSNLKDKIRTHKERMKKKISELDGTLKKNSILHRNVSEWQPRNYIDKIVIAELFSLYGEAIRCVRRKNKKEYERYLKEFDDHSFVTNHPYVPLQKARLLKSGLKVFYNKETSILTQVEHLYEEAIESIEYDYRYLIGTVAHASLLMLFGIFLSENLKQEGRAIRFLEDAKAYHGDKRNKGWFIICNYLSKAYKNKYIETNDSAYRSQLVKIVREVLKNNEKSHKSDFDIQLFKQQFSEWLPA
ncbi:TPA: ATP-binding protein [Enterobacter cloacae]